LHALFTLHAWIGQFWLDTINSVMLRAVRLEGNRCA
jgi:hypothetical protein